MLQAQLQEQDGQHKDPALLARQVLSMSELFFLLKKKSINTNEIFARLKDLIIKAMLCVQSDLIFNYKLAMPSDTSFWVWIRRRG